MRDPIETQFGRRRLYLVSGLFVGGLAAIRLTALSGVSGRWEVLQNLLDAISGATVVAVGLVLFTAVFLRRSGGPPLEQIEPWQIRETLSAAHLKTDSWWYVGHSGRHFRSVTLPTIERLCAQDNRHRDVNLVILDPLDLGVCQYYGRYRRSLRTAHSASENWDIRTIQYELCATILATAELSSRSVLVSCRIAVSGRVSPFRLDLSSSMAFITKEDPREPALRIDRDSHFYGSWGEEARMCLEQCRALTVPEGMKTISKMDGATIIKTLAQIGVGVSDLTEVEAEVIRGLVVTRSNPYA